MYINISGFSECLGQLFFQILLQIAFHSSLLFMVHLHPMVVFFRVTVFGPVSWEHQTRFFLSASLTTHRHRIHIISDGTFAIHSFAFCPNRLKHALYFLWSILLGFCADAFQGL